MVFTAITKVVTVQVHALDAITHITICHENITQLIRKNSNRVTVIKNNSTRTGVPTG